MIRLFVIEDHSLIIDGLKRIFIPSRDKIWVCRTATDVSKIAEADPGSFDVIILDLWLENRDPEFNIRTIRKTFPEKPIIVYTSEERIFWIKKMQDEGATAYLSKRSGRPELKEAIIKSVAGEKYFPVLSSQVPPDDFSRKFINISPVQKKIIEMLIKGHSQKEISGELGLSISTIVKSLHDMKQEFNVKSVPELIKCLYCSDERDV